MELLPYEPKDITRSRSLPNWVQPTALVLSGAFCLTIVLWAISEFLALRGVIHMLASRIFLGIALAFAILGWFSWSRLFAKKRTFLFWVGALVLTGSAFWVDWWAPKPKAAEPLTVAPPEAKRPPQSEPPSTKPNEKPAPKIREVEEYPDGTRIIVTVGPSPEPTYPYQTRFILTNNNRHTIVGTIYSCEPPKTDMNKILSGLKQPVIQQDVISGPIGDLAPGDSFSMNCEAPAAFWLNNAESPLLKIWIEYRYGLRPIRRGFAFLGLRNPDSKEYSWVPRGAAN